MATLILGTRGSALALWQADWVTAALTRAHPGLTLERRIIKTEGDIQQELPIGPGDVGVFVRRIEEALLKREIDVAVHSLKDLPTDQPAELVVAAIPPRHDPRDALLTLDGQSLLELREGARVGTSSQRRRSQLLRARPDLNIAPLRGNVDTRVRKLRDGNFDALVLAVAGVERLGITEAKMQPLDTDLCVPAVGQGALGIEVRSGDTVAIDVVDVLDDSATRAAVEVERAFLRKLGGGCMAPAAAYAQVNHSGVVVRAMVGSLDGRRVLTDNDAGPSRDAESIGIRLAERLLHAGAADLLREAREDDGSSSE